jgi:excisionase family DNA binding protein
MALEDLPEFLTVEEAAAMLRISRTSAYLLTERWRYTRGHSGLPVQRLGRLWRVSRSAIERMAVSPGDAA